MGVSPERIFHRVGNGISQHSASAASCWREQGRIPNYIYVDWYGQGDVMKAVRTLNEMPR